MESIYAKLILVALLFWAGFSAGYGLSSKIAQGKIQSAIAEKETLRAGVAEAAARQASINSSILANQSKISMEVSSGYSARRSDLNTRISSGGLRSATAASCSDLPGFAKSPIGIDPTPAQSVAVESNREANTVPNAARDAQQLAEIIDWLCKQGMCPN